MNRKMVIQTVGRIILLEAVLLILPLIVSFIYGDHSMYAFLITIGIALIVGGLATLLSKPDNKNIYAKDGFVIVALSWIFASLIGCLPFIISREIPSFVNAFFETVSGFTTTGSSIVTDLSTLSHAVLFWRSFTHWIGGMGIIVLITAIVPVSAGRSMHILRAEMPGPVVGKLVPKARSTSLILYLIYMVITVAEVAFLLFGGNDLFTSLLLSFGTAGTGGFGLLATSIGSYSAYTQIVITVFMMMFGINFNLYFFLLMSKFKSAFKNSELILYLSIFAVSSIVIAVNIMSVYNNFGDSLRNATFQVASILTTTGYSTANYDTWPILSRSILFIMMFIGGCAGSTGGGFKVSRVIIVFKSIKRNLNKLIHPQSVENVKIDGKALDETTVNNVSAYFALYSVLILLVFLLISFEPFGIESNLSAAITCFNNVGPGVGMCGPAGSFADYSWFSKIVLSIAMLFGRLEIYPLIFLLSPRTWTKN